MAGIKTLEDFLARTRLADEPHPVLGTKCRLWTKGRAHKDYGHCHYKGQQWRTHRLAWVLAGRDIPLGNNVCHLCDNPPCVELSHLFIGTQAENIWDMLRKGRAKFPPRKNGPDKFPCLLDGRYLKIVLYADGTASFLDPFTGAEWKHTRSLPPGFANHLPVSTRLKLARHFARGELCKKMSKDANCQAQNSQFST